MDADLSKMPKGARPAMEPGSLRARLYTAWEEATDPDLKGLLVDAMKAVVDRDILASRITRIAEIAQPAR